LVTFFFTDFACFATFFPILVAILSSFSFLCR
jgi:hypothetical protein